MTQIAHAISPTLQSWMVVRVIERCSQQCGRYEGSRSALAPGPALSNRAGRGYLS
jgi:hypothetical protein